MGAQQYLELLLQENLMVFLELLVLVEQAMDDDEQVIDGQHFGIGLLVRIYALLDVAVNELIAKQSAPH